MLVFMQADENLRGAKGVYGRIIQFFDENSPDVPAMLYHVASRVEGGAGRVRE